MHRRIELPAIARTAPLAAVFMLATVVACGDSRGTTAQPAAEEHVAHAATVQTASGAVGARAPNEMGRIPVLMYHLIGDKESSWGRERGNFRKDLELLYERGYRPVNMVDVLDRKIDLAEGLSPVVFTFDDASPSQFRYIEQPDGKLAIDSTSAVGIWLDFAKSHPGWGNKAVFCMLPAAAAGHAFFGEKNIEGQKSAWRFKKVQQLAAMGFELCDHTLWHAQLNKYSDAVVQEQIARGLMAIDSAVPGYKVRSFALPLGIWPKNKALAKSGEWTDPKSGKTVRYDFDAIFEVWGTPVPSPYSPAFNPLSVQRVKVTGNSLVATLDHLDKSGERYVSDGKANVVAGRRLRAARAAHAPPERRRLFYRAPPFRVCAPIVRRTTAKMA
ncbi:MAG: polysaccharide deacetylase family protein [Gemmatimonadaceae bacterium]|nr:polysaccharide deacetylase family protein [Gemmatimonadaceae bacterium]